MNHNSLILRIDKDIALLMILLLTSITSGVAVQAILICTVITMLFRNHFYSPVMIARLKQFGVPLILYVLLFAIMLLRNKFDTAGAIRLYGLTKASMGISLCILIAPTSAKRGCVRAITIGVILLDIIFMVSGRLLSQDMLNIGSINVYMATSMLLLPHVIISKELSRTSKAILCLLILLMAFSYRSGTFVFGAVVIFFFLLIDFLRRKIRSRSSIKNFGKICILIIAVVLIVSIVNKRLLNNYMSLLDILDIDRFNILSDAIQQYSKWSIDRKMFGIGDNSYFHAPYVTPAHNAIMEMLMLYGVLGLCTMIVELVLIIRLILNTRMDKTHSLAVITSIFLAYMYFLVQPFYTSSFMMKVVLTFACMNTAYNGMISDEDAQPEIIDF